MNKSWTVKNRTKWFWWNVRNSGQVHKVVGKSRVAGWWHGFWHCIMGPSTGCSCTFCFVSKRRKFPPGHPMHPTQLQATLEKKFDKLLQDIRIQREDRHRRVWGGE